MRGGILKKCCIFANWITGFRGRVARQRSAKPYTAVRLRSKPLVKPASVKAAGFLFSPRKDQVFRYQDQQEGKQATEDDAKQGPEKLIQSEHFKEEKREVVNEHQRDGII